jgi:hypothetical protein
MTVNVARTALLPSDRGSRQHLKIMQMLASVEADSGDPLVQTLIQTMGRLRRGMTAVIITPSLDPAWVRPLAALRARGVACVVVNLDAAAYRRAASPASPVAGEGGPHPGLVVDDESAKRARALRHALAEYELTSYTITPGRPLAEILAR